jgi:hypothetical protein
MMWAIYSKLIHEGDFMALNFDVKDVLGSIGTVIAAIFVFLTYYKQFKSIETKEKQNKQVIADAQLKVESQPEKTKPAWDLARATLESYFNRNLSQVTSIFWLSVLVMFAGFVVIVWGIAQAIQTPDSYTPATLAGLAGIITEFIGATFLFIYRSTIQQALDYSKTLERINSVGMAMQILDTMPDKTDSEDLKSKTKATLVELLIRQAYGIPENKAEKKEESKA